MKPLDIALLALIALFGPPRGNAQQIAITFDDLPAHSILPPNETRMQVAAAVVAALHYAHVPPTYGFVNGIRIEEQPADAQVLDLWRKSGNLLGNHTWSHMNLNSHTAQDFEADILRNNPVIQARMQGLDWRWLRYPYLAEGDTPQKRDAVRTLLAQRHFKIAAVTMSFGDYLWNEPYARCSAKGDAAAIQTLETSYLQAAAEDADYRRKLSKAIFGHDISYVLLMHIGAFDARMLPRLLALYQARGFRFISLQQAEADPFYANDLNPSLPADSDSLEAAAAAHHIAIEHADITPPTTALCN